MSQPISPFSIVATLALALLCSSCRHGDAQAQRTPDALRPAAAVQTCTVVRVSDGDSLQVRCSGPGSSRLLRLRIRAIDAPELRQRHGQAARQALLRLCLNQRVILPRQPETDRYGRALVDLHCQQTDTATHLVAAGLAWVYRGTASEYPHLQGLERQAQRARKGLWGDRSPTPPWTWRQSQPR